MEKTKNTILISAAVTILLLILYIPSYCFVVPITENIGAGYGFVGYWLYRPVEYLRVKSDIIWRISELGYESMGGKTEPLKRTNSDNTVLKDIHLDSQGRIITRTLAKKQGIYQFLFEHWYASGKMKLKYSEEESAFRIQAWYDNGQLAYDEKTKDDKTGFSQTWDKNGLLIGECEYVNYRPWNGKHILWNKKFKYHTDDDYGELETITFNTYTKGVLISTEEKTINKEQENKENSQDTLQSP